MGAHTSMLQTSTYADADAVVLTGIAHGQNHDFALRAHGNLRPAGKDGAFADAPAGYVTTIPGTRESDFYAGERVEDEVHHAVIIEWLNSRFEKSCSR
jgi:hypothetical protein